MSVLSLAKYYYSKLNLENGWNDEYVKTSFGVKYTEEKADFFMRFYGCLLGDKFCNKMTELYIKTPLTSMRETIAKYNNENKENRVNENTALSQMNYCSGKLKEIFKDNEMLNNIWNCQDTISEIYHRQLNEFVEKYGVKGNQKKEFAINIPSYKRCGEVTSREFIDFLRLLEPYSKRMMKKVQKEINSRTKEIGYFNYITKPGMELTPQELADKELVEIMLGQRDGELPREEIAFGFEDDEKEMFSELDEDLVPDFTEEEDEPVIDLSTPPVEMEETQKTETPKIDRVTYGHKETDAGRTYKLSIK